MFPILCDFIVEALQKMELLWFLCSENKRLPNNSRFDSVASKNDLW